MGSRAGVRLGAVQCNVRVLQGKISI